MSVCVCRQVYDGLVSAGTLVPAADKPVPPMPQDLSSAVAQGKVRHTTLCVCVSTEDITVLVCHGYHTNLSV